MVDCRERICYNFYWATEEILLSLHHNGVNSYKVVNGVEIYKFKAKDSEINVSSLCPGNVSEDFWVNNVEKSGLNEYVYNFSVNYDSIDVDDILDIHKYVLVKNNTK